MQPRLFQVFRAVLLLYLLVLLQDADSSSSGRCKIQEKSKCLGTGHTKSSRNLKKDMWVILDPTLNISTFASPSPNRSLSPWTYETSYDDSRIPLQISEAKCEKRGCLNENGEEDLGLESKPIFYQIHVLRRVKGKNKRYTLKLENKIISVGCTCVLPIVVPQI
ncbi:interleukin 17a/f3 isoform X2 [Myxocyprinus asiaticus]|uniref:interleukin 17a/f3 isoform X2 n=1 Tax=Myxocyprinus asiaticus TaxID=70543 RepID=UPI0022230DE4|nr:interleukin 17a/f3 isoform X2 [Myxocyprinus asiaticus]